MIGMVAAIPVEVVEVGIGIGIGEEFVAFPVVDGVVTDVEAVAIPVLVGVGTGVDDLAFITVVEVGMSIGVEVVAFPGVVNCFRALRRIRIFIVTCERSF